MTEIIAISPTTEAIAKAAADRIRGFQRKIINDVVEIGRELIRVKERLGHGNFGPWLKAEFDWSERTAQNYISVVESFGANPQRVSYLPLKTVYSLAAPSTPDTLRNEIVGRIEAGEVVSSSDISIEISTARRQAKRERKDAKKTPEARAKDRKAQERRARRFESQRAELADLAMRRDFARLRAAKLIVEALDDVGLDELVELLEIAILGKADLLAAKDLIDAQRQEARQ